MRKVDVRKIKWCFNQKNVDLIEPNENLSREYLRSAEETYEELILPYKKRSRMWLATQKYYFEYFLVYAILMRFGIKCEIHECTIELAKILEIRGFLPKNFSKKLEEDKELRIMNQYYLKNIRVDINPKELRNDLLTFKDILLKITDEDVLTVRDYISSLLKHNN